MAFTPGKLIWLTFILLASAYIQYTFKKPTIAEHLLNNPVRVHENLIDNDTQSKLLEIVKEIRYFPTNANDLFTLNRTYEHIGEAEKIRADGTCDSRFLIPNKEATACILPSRFDLAYHFMKYGGIDGLKEQYASLATRMQSFGRYIFDLEEYPAMKQMFTAEKFVQDAVEVCPKNKQILHPFQYHLIIQIPGQTVPLHLDAPYFTDASRFQYPVWLLVAMVGSGLYQEKFIDQVQIVVNLHEWNSTKNGGQFAYYSQNDIKPTNVQPFPKTATIMDGSKVIHAATIYKHRVTPPILPKNAKNVLEHVGDETWRLSSNGRELHHYKTSDLRITVVYRAKCFESELDRDVYKQWFMTAKEDEIRPVDSIVGELKGELIRRELVTQEALQKMSPIQVAIKFIEEFIRYPLPPKALIPFNYCMLGVTHPQFKKYVDLIC